MREATIVNHPAFRAAGVYYLGGNEHGELKALWDNDFLPRMGELAGIRVSGEAFGLIRGIPDATHGEFEYLASVEVPASAKLPAGMVSWEIPAKTYVVVRADDLAQIAPVLGYIYNEWLPGSTEWECGPGVMFEAYPPDFARPSMAVDVYWPIQHKQGTRVPIWSQAVKGAHKMHLQDIVQCSTPPKPWAEGDKIPWNDPEFSRRMLREHLSQEHDAASRRSAVIDRQVAWIHRQVLGGRPARILDLGCGPGLYDARLARLGHECVGIDFSPASIAYARAEAGAAGLCCSYVEQDIRTADYGMGHGLAMLIFGELNVFRPEDARLILRKAHAALAEEGQLLLEPHTYDAVRRSGEAPSSWYATAAGLFAARPHLCLEESHWDSARQAATSRYYIVDAATGQVTRHAASMQAYTERQYRELLAECGFGAVEMHGSLTGDAEEAQDGLVVIVAHKGGTVRSTVPLARTGPGDGGQEKHGV
jgi:predicted transcriptional regulator YdeE/SAM-dependent methyltransferase